MIAAQEEKRESAQIITKHRPQLSLEKLKESIDESKEYQEMEGYSITPTTFHSRSFFDKPTWYKDTFKYADQEVTRFSINAKSLLPQAILDEKIELQVVDQSERTRLTGSYKQEDAWTVKHHSLEVNLLQQAIDYLLGNEACKAVLVDIFERINDKIKVKGDVPKIHTVVLYKNPILDSGKYEVTVIDPSNFLFSSHLSKPDLGIIHPILSRIITVHKSIQVYKAPSGDMVGPNKDQYRDCIDIAVKIAFGLSQHEWTMIDSEKQVKKHPVIQSISNDIELDKNIIVKTVPARIKQASDIHIVEKFNKTQKVLKENFSLIDIKYPELYISFLKKHHKHLGDDKTYSGTLEKLVNSNAECLIDLTHELTTEHKILAGQINENF